MPEFFAVPSGGGLTKATIIKAGLYSIAASTVTLWTPAASKKIVLYGLTIEVRTLTATVNLRGNTIGTFLSLNTVAPINFVSYQDSMLGIFIANELIQITSVGNSDGNYSLWGIEI